MQYRKTQAHINLSAIRHNISEHQKLVGPDCSLMAVVKADGYGHGAIPVLKAAMDQGVTWAGVALAEEAVQLRNAGINLPILLLGGWFPGAIPAMLEYNITPSLYSMALARDLNAHVRKRNTHIDVHLKVDTGMSRLGFSESQLIEFVNSANEFDCLNVSGFFTHLSSADEDDPSFSNGQIRKFNLLLEILNRWQKPDWVHTANSAGTSRQYGNQGNLFRLGISMYGMPPSLQMKDSLDLVEVVTWTSAVVHLQWYSPNSPIGYGRTFYTTRKTHIATICAGYADGYFRCLSNRGYVLIGGQRAPVVGMVCMDMFMVDVTHIENVEVNDEVVLIGRQNDEYISATEMADWSQTVNYEITCSISSRVPRLYS